MSVHAEIAAERRRQRTAEGWSTRHDDCHTKGELAKFAAAYILYDHPVLGPIARQSLVPFNWALKPKSKRRDLIRACALLEAEIERIDRAALRLAGALE